MVIWGPFWVSVWGLGVEGCRFGCPCEARVLMQKHRAVGAAIMLIRMVTVLVREAQCLVFKKVVCSRDRLPDSSEPAIRRRCPLVHTIGQEVRVPNMLSPRSRIRFGTAIGSKKCRDFLCAGFGNVCFSFSWT